MPIFFVPKNTWKIGSKFFHIFTKLTDTKAMDIILYTYSL